MENRIEKGFLKEDAYQTLGLVNHWIEVADNKASILLALIALLIGLSSSVFMKFPLVLNLFSIPERLIFGVLTMLIIIAYLSLGSATIIFLVRVLVARLHKSNYSIDRGKNLIFFGDIAQMDSISYLKKINEVSQEDFFSQIVEQVVVNSKIASLKMKYFNKALACSFVFFALTMVLFVFTSLLLN